MRWSVGAVLSLLATAAAAADRTPVLVELFTSEGCSSCPPADEALAALAVQQPVAGAEIIPLELHVDYWNSLGWVDPFSLPEATARQERYASAGPRGAGSLFTPQMVVDGTRSFVGNRQLAAAAVGQAMALSKRTVHAELRPAPGGVDVHLLIGPGEEHPVGLWLALTESGLSSKVTTGENQGRTLVHAAVVRSLEQVTTVSAAGWTGTVRLPLVRGWHREALTVVAFVQDRTSGRVVGIGTARMPPVTAAGDSPGAPSLH
jgi:hypothetical protein